jgi:hypothetical protein
MEEDFIGNEGPDRTVALQKRKKTENKQCITDVLTKCLTKDVIWLFQKLGTTSVTPTGTTFRTAVRGGPYLTTYSEATLCR